MKKKTGNDDGGWIFQSRMAWDKEVYTKKLCFCDKPTKNDENTEF